MKHHIPRYSCNRAWMDNGGPRCIAFGGLRVDDAIEEALLGVVGPGTIAAATAAARKPANGGIRCAMRSVATSKRRARAPTGPSGNAMPVTPRTGWWRASLKRAGIRRLPMPQRWNARLPPTTLHGRCRPLIRTAPTTDARLKKCIVGTLTTKSRPISTMWPRRSFSSSTRRAAPTASCACPSAGADSATAPLPISSKPCPGADR